MNEIKQDDCVIERVIVHVLDNTRTEPLLTDFEVTLPAEYNSLLRSHISTSLQSSIPSRFDDRESNNVYLMSEAAFNSPDTEFVGLSQKLTSSLFPLMRKQSINAGTLWVVLFRRENVSDEENNKDLKYLAILKMDDKSSLTWRQESDADGNLLLHLEGNDHTVPQAEVRLDKAAFIFPQTTLPDGKLLFDYDLRVLDRKLSRGNVADYFAAFLGCSAAFEAKRGTQRFLTTIDRFTNKLTAESNKKVEQLKQAGAEAEAASEEMRVSSAVQDIQLTKTLFLSNHDEVENDEYAKAALGDREPEIKERLVKELRKSIDADSFHVDEDTRRRFKQRTVWKLQNGNYKVEIRGDRESFAAMVDDTNFKSDNIITIRATDLKAA